MLLGVFYIISHAYGDQISLYSHAYSHVTLIHAASYLFNLKLHLSISEFLSVPLKLSVPSPSLNLPSILLALYLILPFTAICLFTFRCLCHRTVPALTEKVNCAFRKGERAGASACLSVSAPILSLMGVIMLIRGSGRALNAIGGQL